MIHYLLICKGAEQHKGIVELITNVYQCNSHVLTILGYIPRTITIVNVGVTPSQCLWKASAE